MDLFKSDARDRRSGVLVQGSEVTSKFELLMYIYLLIAEDFLRVRRLSSLPDFIALTNDTSFTHEKSA